MTRNAQTIALWFLLCLAWTILPPASTQKVEGVAKKAELEAYYEGEEEEEESSGDEEAGSSAFMSDPSVDCLGSFAATIASTALPPSRKMAAPACAAR